ncbi:hypothetical protein PUNSTDRAFT_141737 [Punctularia strigosozonata HHB-11173 SS5]|uniref:uncharacterized protein n=1 Tax=Punctularia strigosozonata (strain HHB-11173) TaxID=741275 RepID=UPI0004416FCB|nr:uncharacterized protein PUNSTDRAFT_141737 [Punctularia strigosozonata HHB-11173 SS5]EIN11331.1 hypothetical protein PUNSTDRAFT_141737 [Punctularia strigosozonata HHB-11173 SS5]
MRMRHHAQRQHIIHSIDRLLYQLHTLSFFYSPSIWAYLGRCITQFNFARPREIDSKRSLRFWYALVLLVNISCISHAIQGASEGSIMLDFVGIGHKPSKPQLLFLDLLIMFLQTVLVTVAYETSFANDFPGLPDALAPAVLSTMETPATPQPSSSHAEESHHLLDQDDRNKSLDFTYDAPVSPYVVDLRLKTIWTRLIHPPSANSVDTRQALPFPNTAPTFDPSRPIGWFLRARARREEMRARLETRGGEFRRSRRSPSDGIPSDADQRTLPGAIDQ